MERPPDWFDGSFNGLNRSECVSRLKQIRAPKPWTLYKFCGPHHPSIQGFIQRSELYLSSPAKFNDPFDTAARVTFSGSEAEYFALVYRIAIDQGRSPSEAMYVAATNPLSKRPDFQPLFDRRIAQWGVSCFISSKAAREHAARNILMWSHYAEGHKGVCFQFHIPSSPGVLASALPVKYSDDFVVADWALRDQVETRLAEALTRKAKIWSYEQERRIIRTAGNAGARLPFNGAALKGVIFGVQVAEATTSEVVEHCRARKLAGMPKIRLFRAMKVPARYELRVCRARDLEHKVDG